MPIYDFKCTCGEQITDKFVKSWETKVTCKCGKVMNREFPNRVGGSIFPADGIVLHNVGPKPIKVNSYKEAKQLQKKHNVELGCVL